MVNMIYNRQPIGSMSWPKSPGPTRGRGRTKIAELFADERCSKAILDFLPYILNNKPPRTKV